MSARQKVFAEIKALVRSVVGDVNDPENWARSNDVLLAEMQPTLDDISARFDCNATKIMAATIQHLRCGPVNV